MLWHHGVSRLSTNRSDMKTGPRGAGMDSDTGVLDADWQPQRIEPDCPWPVDRTHLARYTLGDVALEREVLQLFMAETPQRVGSLKTARSEKEWKMAAHTLKGSARAIGAWKLSKLAQHAERFSGPKDGAACTEVICQLEEAVADVESYIAREYYPSSAPV